VLQANDSADPQDLTAIGMFANYGSERWHRMCMAIESVAALAKNMKAWIYCSSRAPRERGFPLSIERRYTVEHPIHYFRIDRSGYLLVLVMDAFLDPLHMQL
jgi:hypothetical protein